MFKGKGEDYFGMSGDSPEPKKAPITTPSDNDGDEKPVATITVHKGADGMKFKHDEGDGMPADEYNSLDELVKGLEEKYGADKVEQAEEKVAPGVHEKAGSYLEKAMK